MPAQRPSLLIVEDDDRLRYLLLAAAERSGAYSALAAVADGALALDFVWSRLRQHEPLPRYIMSDLSMPRMDGISLVRELKRHPETRHIPIGILTSSILPADREAALAAGAASYHRKPLHLDELISLFASLPHLCASPAEPLPSEPATHP